MSAGVVAGILIFEVFLAGLLAWLYLRGDIIIFQYPADLASITLTAAGLLLAIATAIIALFALWGIRELLDRAEAAARDSAKKTADAYVESPEFDAKIYRIASEFVRFDLEAGVDAPDKDADLAAAMMEKDGDDNG